MNDFANAEIKYKGLKVKELSSDNVFSILFLITIISGSAYLSFKNYLLFHSTMEIFSSSIAFCMLIISINTYGMSKNNFSIFLGIAYGFVGGFDILHTFAYKGMGIFNDESSNIATQLWISARYIEAITLLLSCRVFNKSSKKIKHYYIYLVYFIISIVLLLSIFSWHIFPNCLVPGQGLTKFKIISEYIISVIILIAIILFFHNRKKMDKRVNILIEISLIMTIFSEISFTLYANPIEFTNMLGHIFKVISFYFLYKAVIETDLKTPYKLLFRKLKRTNKDLAERTSQLKRANKKYQEENAKRLFSEKELLNNQACCRILIERFNDSIIIHDGSKFIFANDNSLAITGVSSVDEIMGAEVADFIPEDCMDSIRSIIGGICSGKGSVPPVETKLRQKNGNMIDVEITATYFTYEDKPAVLNIIRDITSKRQVQILKKDVEKNLKLLNETMEYNKLITEFFSNISHELKTPLNVILSALQIMDLYNKYDKNLSAYYNCLKYQKIMRQNCYRLLRLINNLIDLSKIDSGFLELHLKNYNIINLVEDITLSVADYIGSKGINLIFDTDAEEKIIACDGDKIERIMLNLLSNAVKFTNPGDEIFVNMIDKDESIQISIRDTGIGIPKEKIDSIFNRFSQVGETLARNQQGSGIGLSLVKSLIEMHGGTISIQSEVNKGTEFIIELPVKVLDENVQDNSKEMYSGKVETINIEFSDIYSVV